MVTVQQRQLEISKKYLERMYNESTVSRRFENSRTGDFNLQNGARGPPEAKTGKDVLQAVVEAEKSQNMYELAPRFEVLTETSSMN